MWVTMLPWPHLSTSAAALAPEDVETQYDIAGWTYQALRDGTASGPAVEMWRGHAGALLYWWGCLAAVRPAGALQSIAYLEAWKAAYRASEMAVGPLPWWLGDTAFHLRCQSRLIMKRPSVYGKQFVHAPLDLAWWWPIGENEWQIVFE